MISLIEIFRILRKGNTPTEIDWKAIFSSVWHKSEKILMSSILGLLDILKTFATKEELANATTNFKGYHTSLADLLVAYPQVENKKDFYAWVGSPYPGTVWKVFADGGVWTDTGEVPTQQDVDLTEYGKKVDEHGNRLVYAPDGKVDTPEHMVYHYQPEGGSEDITVYANLNVKEKIGIKGDTGLSYVQENATSIQRLKLKPNTKYTMRGLGFPTDNTQNATFHFFNTSTPTVARVSQLFFPPNKDMVFTTNSTDIYVSFYIEIVNNLQYQFSSRNFQLFEGDPSESLVDYTTGESLVELGKIVVFKDNGVRADSTDDAKATIINASIDGNSGVTTIPYEHGTIVNKFLLERGSIYTYVAENPFPPTYNFVQLFLYNDNSNSALSNKNILPIGDRKTYTFETPTDEDTYLSFYTNISAASGYPPYVNNNFKLAYVRHNYELVTPKGDPLLEKTVYTEKGSYIENVNIPEENIVPFGTIGIQFNDGAQAGGHGITPAPGYNSVLIKRLPVEEGWWYTFDLGLYTNGSCYLFGYDKVVDLDTKPAIIWVPFTGKQTLFISKEIKSVSFYAKVTYKPNNLDYDATQSLKITRSKVAPKGFDTDYGFLDLKSIQGVIDHSGSAKITLPFPKHYGIFKTWGSSAGMSADKRVMKKFELYVDGHYVSGYSEIGFQGSSSINYTEKNEKDKFLLDDGKTKLDIQIGTYPSRNKYHRKANYVDILNVKGIVVPRVWQRVLDSYPDENRYLWSTPFDENEIKFDKRFDVGARMHIDGFPVAHYDNGAFIGIKTFQLTTERIDFNMSKNNINQNVFKSQGGNAFNEPVSKPFWEEVNSDTEGVEIPDDRFAVLQNFDNWLRTSSLSVFKDTAHEWMDIRSFIDYYLIGYWAYLLDNFGNNMLLGTYDGKKMTAILRDLDNSCGTIQAHAIKPNAEFNPTLGGVGWVVPSASRLWSRLEAAFMPEIKARYVELRDSGILNADTFIKEFRHFEETIPYELLKLRAEMHPQILTNRDPNTVTALGILFDGGCYNSFKRTYWWFKERQKHMDKKFGG